jgi:hypothetical protein
MPERDLNVRSWEERTTRHSLKGRQSEFLLFSHVICNIYKLLYIVPSSGGTEIAIFFHLLLAVGASHKQEWKTLMFNKIMKDCSTFNAALRAGFRFPLRSAFRLGGGDTR